MATSLAEIRARLAAQNTATTTTSSNSEKDRAVYPHWDIPEGTMASVRFLPDADASNSFFWVERAMINLPFNGVLGDPNSKKVTIKVPCIEMYGQKEYCPILSEVRNWYKDESMKELANQYWKKRTYLFQGFVRANPMAEDTTPDNPIRRFIISPQIFTIIKASLMDPEMEEMPTDYLRGLDFNFKKTTKGQYSDYSTSNWSRKETSLSEFEIAAIEAHGLYNLADFLPKRPSDIELRVLKEMFEASVDGLAYDPDKWGAYYKPYGLQSNGQVQAPRTESTSVFKQPIPSHSVTDADIPPFDTSDAPVYVKPAAPAATTNTVDKKQALFDLIKSHQNKS